MYQSRHYMSLPISTVVTKRTVRTLSTCNDLAGCNSSICYFGDATPHFYAYSLQDLDRCSFMVEVLNSSTADINVWQLGTCNHSLNSYRGLNRHLIYCTPVALQGHTCYYIAYIVFSHSPILSYLFRDNMEQPEIEWKHTQYRVINPISHSTYHNYTSKSVKCIYHNKCIIILNRIV